jgi:hypothetical protein
MNGTDRFGFNTVKEQPTHQELDVTIPWQLAGFNKGL